MLAALAHHLRAALVLLDGHLAHGAELDEVRVEEERRVGQEAARGEAPLVLLARGDVGVPLGAARRAEVRVAGRAVHGLGLAALRRPGRSVSRARARRARRASARRRAAQHAHRLAARPRAPRARRVAVHLCEKETARGHVFASSPGF